MECSDQKTKIHESVDARAPVAQECHEHKHMQRPSAGHREAPHSQPVAVL